jgi:hypothetical protein
MVKELIQILFSPADKIPIHDITWKNRINKLAMCICGVLVYKTPEWKDQPKQKKIE